MSRPGEGLVAANGRQLRYAETGHGPPLVHLQPGPPQLTPAHALLGQRFRVVALETPAGAGAVVTALTTLGIETFDLIGSAAAGEVALRLAAQSPGRVRALVLETPPASLEDDVDGMPWASIAAPALVLIGTRDGAATTHHGLVARIPGCHLVVVYDAGPAIGADRPEAFAEVVADFLDRHEAFVISRAATRIHP
jgi:pimeloyl-ACP methyl ester carboxylesterase